MDYPVEIRSVQFKETTVQSDCKVDDLKPEFGKFIFVDYERHSSEEFIDVMLKDKVFHSYYLTIPCYTVLKARHFSLHLLPHGIRFT